MFMLSTLCQHTYLLKREAEKWTEVPIKTNPILFRS